MQKSNNYHLVDIHWVVVAAAGFVIAAVFVVGVAVVVGVVVAADVDGHLKIKKNLSSSTH